MHMEGQTGVKQSETITYNRKTSIVYYPRPAFEMWYVHN